MDIAHLTVRSGYSFYRSMIQIEDYVKHGQSLQYETLTLTEDSHFFSAIPFYNACRRANIKPILGMIVQVVYKESEVNLTLLAQNKEGFHKLMKLSSEIQSGKLFEDLISKYVGDIFCVVHTEDNVLRDFMYTNQHLLFTFVGRLEELYGNSNVYVQIPPHNSLIEQAKELEEDFNIKFVAMQDVRFLNKEDYKAYDCLTHMENKEIWNEQAISEDVKFKYLRSKQEFQELYKDYPEAIERNAFIVKNCRIEIDFNRQLLPTYPVPKGETAESFLKKLCYKQVEKKYHPVTKIVRERLEKELEIIIDLGFADYFLIVADYVSFAKRSKIPVGPGRGSAAGSLVSYILSITDVDPIKYNLLFERFLNPERVTMPDIDIDFSDRQREEVVNYIRQKYGDEYVAKIITFDTYGTRSLIRELIERLNIDPYDKNYILSELKNYQNEPLKDFIHKNDSLKAYIKTSSTLKILFQIAIKLEGLPRHHSIHAAGIVLGENKLSETVPVMKNEDDGYITQFAMNDLEQLGLLKMDILGLRNLSSIEAIVHSIEKTTGEKININRIPENDEKTFKLLQTGKTNGIFQLEANFVKSVLKKLRPSNFEDIVALNALNRPGPMQFIDTFIERKHGKKFDYIHPSVEPILKETYGVLIYQEQIMQIAHTVAGFSLGEADMLRRAVSKKERQLMANQEKAFISGALNKGYDEEIAREIFSWIVQFADYGFPKSHSVAYSKLSYQLSYLKANYPLHFFRAMLNHVKASGEKVSTYIDEAKKINIEVLPPSINKSYTHFTLENNKVRIGLTSIKNVGINTVKIIIEERKNGSYTDLYDFYNRTKVKRHVLENLILAGAFDQLHSNRASLLASIDRIVEKIEVFGTDTLFDNGLTIIKEYEQVDDFTTMEKLADEKELLGFYVSKHPLENYRSILKRKGFITIEQLAYQKLNSDIKLACMIEDVRKITTKNGESMAFVQIVDEKETIDGVVFPKTYRESYDYLKEGQMIELVGRLSERNNKRQVIINNLKPLNSEEYEESKEKLYIRLMTKNYDAAISFLQKISKEQAGNLPIILHNPKTKETYQLNEQFMIKKSKENIHQIASYFGLDHVALK